MRNNTRRRKQSVVPVKVAGIDLMRIAVEHIIEEAIG